MLIDSSSELTGENPEPCRFLSLLPPTALKTTNCVYTSVTEFGRDARHARYEKIREVITQ